MSFSNITAKNSLDIIEILSKLITNEIDNTSNNPIFQTQGLERKIEIRKRLVHIQRLKNLDGFDDLFTTEELNKINQTITDTISYFNT
jgi:hypothetical protein